MDDRKFDTIAQALAADGSRRRVLGVLAGGVAALAGAAALEANRGGNGQSRGRGRGRGRGRDKGNGEGGNGGGNGNGNGGNGNGNGGNGNGRGREKVFVCHRNGNDDLRLIRIAAPAVPAHERHGDVICDDVACQVPVGCGVDSETEEAVCIYTVDESAEGAECAVSEDEAGVCVLGACVAAAEPSE